MRRYSQLPRVLHGGREYANDPAALECAQSTDQEIQLYAAIRARASNWWRKNRRAARILDLCAATGLTTATVAQAVPVASATLIDTDLQSLTLARNRLSGSFQVDIRVEDACQFHSNLRYDLILMNSAYHHIEDAHKTAFLAMARRHLEEDGHILMGEHVLPPYILASNESYQRSVTRYYEELVSDLTRKETPSSAVSVIRRAGEYGWQGMYEYKTSYSVLEQHLRAAGLHTRFSKFVWKCAGSIDAGAVVLELEGRSDVADAHA